jgi:hypothetical protein
MCSTRSRKEMRGAWEGMYGHDASLTWMCDIRGSWKWKAADFCLWKGATWKLSIGIYTIIQNYIQLLGSYTKRDVFLPFLLGFHSKTCYVDRTLWRIPIAFHQKHWFNSNLIIIYVSLGNGDMDKLKLGLVIRRVGSATSNWEFRYMSKIFVWDNLCMKQVSI